MQNFSSLWAQCKFHIKILQTSIVRKNSSKFASDKMMRVQIQKKRKNEGKFYLFDLICAEESSNKCLLFVYVLNFINLTK